MTNNPENFRQNPEHLAPGEQPRYGAGEPRRPAGQAVRSDDPDAIRRDIERTRANLSYDVNALADEADPRNMAARQVDRAKNRVLNLKERIMGSRSDYEYDERTGVHRRRPGAAEQARQGLADAGHAVEGAAEDARHAIEQAPERLRRQTRGNPLSAGLIAFGIGALIGGLMPVTDAERRVSRDVKRKAEPFLDEAKELAQDSADRLRPQAEAAVEQVKGTAEEGVEHVRADADVARSEVQDQAQRSQQNVQDKRNP